MSGQLRTGSYFSGERVNQDLAQFGTGYELPAASFVDLPQVEN